MQIYLKKDNNSIALTEGTLLAVGGRYDYLLQQMADSEYVGVMKFIFPCLHLLPLSLFPLNTHMYLLVPIRNVLMIVSILVLEIESTRCSWN